jgi:Uma2 family endonuclease
MTVAEIPTPVVRDTYRFGSGPEIELQPGTIGWTASDLDDPAVERAWFKGRYEILQGVLTIMPPAYFASGNAPFNLLTLLKAFTKARGTGERIAFESDIVIDEQRVLVADAVLLTPDDQRRQEAAVRAAKRPDPQRTRILVPPTLVLESVSPGHEKHDHETKRRWYAEFGVPHYWIVDAYRQSLDCLRLDAGAYVVDAQGTGDATLQPAAFPGLVVPLRDLWND